MNITEINQKIGDFLVRNGREIPVEVIAQNDVEKMQNLFDQMILLVNTSEDLDMLASSRALIEKIKQEAIGLDQQHLCILEKTDQVIKRGVFKHFKEVTAQKQPWLEPGLLERLESLDEKSFDAALQSMFLQSPSSLHARGSFLIKTIDKSLEIGAYSVALKLVNYYACEVFLEGGFSPLCQAGQAIQYVVECAKVMRSIRSVLETLPSSFFQRLEKLEQVLIAFWDVLEKSIAKTPFLTQEAALEIEQNLISMHRADPLLLQIKSKPMYQHRTALLCMNFKKEDYTLNKGETNFDVQVPFVINLAVKEMQKCRGDEAQIRKCFKNLLIYFGSARKNIARVDNTNSAECFGVLRNVNYCLTTDLNGDRYGEYGAKVFNVLKNRYEAWLDLQKQCRSEPFSKEWLSEFHDSFSKDGIVSWEFHYEDSEFSVQIIQGYPLSEYRFYVQHGDIFSDGRLPPVTAFKQRLIHSVFDERMDIARDLEDSFLICVQGGNEKLVTNAAKFGYLFAHATPYQRGSAAIGEWFIRALFQFHNSTFMYGRSEEKEQEVYKPTVDLDALVSGFSEFEEDFIAKCNFSDPVLHVLVPEKEEDLIAKMNVLDSFGLDEMTKEQLDFLKMQKQELFQSAVYRGYEEIVRILLLNKEVDVNQHSIDGLSPLLIACGKGYVGIVDLLLSSKNIDSSCIGHDTPNGLTPFLTACGNGDVNVMRLLLSKGKIDVNHATEDGATPLFLVCQNNKIDAVKLLLQTNEVLVDKARFDGATPLFIACYTGNAEIVRLLLENGADRNKKVGGNTPVEVALHGGHIEVVEVFRKMPKR
jgi:ankyrin repeat protein